MQREIKKYLLDIKESIDSINNFIGGKKNYNDYKADKLLRRAVEREFEIIGEATSRILKIDPTIKISESRRIVDLRNWVIHGYDRVDDIIIWGIISKDLPRLKDQVTKLLKD